MAEAIKKDFPLEARKKWFDFIAFLSSYTLTDRLDIWHEHAADRMPDSILEFSTYKEYEGPNKDDDLSVESEEFYRLQSLFRTTPPYILSLIEIIFDIATVELYGGIRPPAIESLKDINKFIKLAWDNNVTLPDHQLFRRHQPTNTFYGDCFKMPLPEILLGLAPPRQ
ncbi:hypothetical protein [Acanthopleuribacter pedis]|uniref:Uncharacterized protein n=1 Tax=Acanthopleuribacter pedis TaxID=442870 RepID=A0A8J7U5T7_9BACT|nr:hypothetical protein [Acanthopleuribacter pedis]MBO1321194.1 hypothetical protein [Acanthopleuribacter pedis]